MSELSNCGYELGIGMKIHELAPREFGLVTMFAIKKVRDWLQHKRMMTLQQQHRHVHRMHHNLNIGGPNQFFA